MGMASGAWRGLRWRGRRRRRGGGHSGHGSERFESCGCEISSLSGCCTASWDTGLPPSRGGGSPFSVRRPTWGTHRGGSTVSP